MVGEAGTAQEATELVERLRPDVVLMDLGLPDAGGIEVTRTIMARPDLAAILVLTMRDDDASVFAAIHAGAAGYLLKGPTRRTRPRHPQRGHRRSRVRLRHRRPGAGPGRSRPGRRARAARRPLHRPGTRDPRAAGRGLGNQTIARRVGLAPKTVRNHVSVLIAKLQAADRGEAIVRARAAGYGN